MHFLDDGILSLEYILQDSSHVKPPFSHRRGGKFLHVVLRALWIVLSAHLITRCGHMRTSGGIVTPICLAVLRLITSSNLVGCSNGMSAGGTAVLSKAQGRNGFKLSAGARAHPIRRYERFYEHCAEARTPPAN